MCKLRTPAGFRDYPIEARRTLPWAAALLSLALVTGNATAGPRRAQAADAPTPRNGATEEFYERLPLPPGGTFVLLNVNGSVQVDGWEREEVEIHAVKSAPNPADLARVRIAVEQSEGRVTVRTLYPQDDSLEVSVEYRIRVPDRVRLDGVSTVNGHVLVSGVRGSGHLQTVNGRVEVLDGAGGFSARTTNGNIRLELRELSARDREPLAVETVNGAVVLVLPPDAGAEVEVHNVNGDFWSELPVVVEGSLSPQGFRGRLGPGGPRLRLRTVNGGIRVVTARPSV